MGECEAGAACGKSGEQEAEGPAEWKKVTGEYPECAEDGVTGDKEESMVEIEAPDRVAWFVIAVASVTSATGMSAFFLAVTSMGNWSGRSSFMLGTDWMLETGGDYEGPITRID